MTDRLISVSGNALLEMLIADDRANAGGRPVCQSCFKWTATWRIGPVPEEDGMTVSVCDTCKPRYSPNGKYDHYAERLNAVEPTMQGDAGKERGVE